MYPKALDPIAQLELEVIQQIIRDETWLEGERRGQPVDNEDPIVVSSVCDVVMRIGAQLRASFLAENSEFISSQNDNDLRVA